MALGSQSAPFFGAAGAAGGGAEPGIGDRSLRFNSADSAYLDRTPSSAGNQKTWTFSFWTKFCSVANSQFILRCAFATTHLNLILNTNGTLQLSDYSASLLTTLQVFQDFSAWYHIVIRVDTTQASADDRVRIYVNGTQVTQFSTRNNPTQNADLAVNAAQQHFISNSNGYLNAYLADVYLIDGFSLAPGSFGEFDATTGVWNPIVYDSDYGTNGFHLAFSDNSSTSALGTDTSGRGNDWTPNNFAVGFTAGKIYKSSTLYTTKADVLANATLISSGTSLSSEYLYYVPNGTEPSGGKVFDGRGTSSTTYIDFYFYSGASWSNVTGSYFATEYIDFVFGSNDQTTAYTLQNNRDFYVVGSNLGGASPDTITGVAPALGVGGSGNDSLVDVHYNGTETDTGVGGEVRGNYCTLNPLEKTSSLSLLNGNLQTSLSTAAYNGVRGTIGVSTGKWYWEYTQTANVDNGNITYLGISQQSDSLTELYGPGATIYMYQANDGSSRHNGTYNLSYGDSWTSGDIIGVAFDLTSATTTITFYKNGVSQGIAYSNLAAGTYFPSCGLFQNQSGAINFGQRAFAYTAPSGFKALCTANLPTPTIEDGSAYMAIQLWTGNSTNGRAITGYGFSPDFVWIKRRNLAYAHNLFDTVRGIAAGGWAGLLSSNSTAAEDTGNTNTISSFDADGFTLGVDGGVNFNTSTYVGWAWDAGTSTVSNTDGSITSSVRANTTAGFSIVTYTGTGTAPSTVGHGLGAAPSLIFFHRRDITSNWITYNSSIGATKFLVLNNGGAAVTDIGPWNNTAATSTVFTVNTFSDLNANGGTYVAYCFAPVAGYSAFGSYTGNGSSTDGTFINTGFRPRFFLTKASSTTSDWYIWDSTRDSYNASISRLFPNLTDAESVDAANDIDLVSNGIKMRTATANQSGVTYIYAAFAENPFKYARAR